MNGDTKQLETFVRLVNEDLLPQLVVESDDPHEPVVVKRKPRPWKTLGAGNYAAVFLHPDYDEWVVKVYAPGRPGLEDEVEVYRRLGSHPAYSQCLHSGERYLILKRLTGITLYNCILRGIHIPKQVIRDIDEALAYAVSKGLNPHDVHGKNIMVKDGRGVVVDVSDFLKNEPCYMWDDLKKAYNRFYIRPFHKLPVPEFVLNFVRKAYRRLKKR
ncbi:serine/threonine protein kinase [Paenibacillus hamazuiensis]|uniref:serine/threonine protein kinase n=1 Tax=Paenibacillus hamazuiensis TaxID=2936508 RepID=UPI00200CE5C2|nr:serine/threonine protein kinase [Paenibacillus hamazuiensis]